LYRDALVVPYGLSTRVSADDVAGALQRLADGRAEVVVLNGADAAGAAAAAADAGGVAVDSGAHAALVTPANPAPPGPLRSAAPATAGSTAVPGVAPPLRQFPSGVDAPAARREDVTIALRRGAVDGALALSAPPDEVLTEELPEIAELRRGTDEPEAGEGSGNEGNVALIIDATTDLSARAMRRVRRAAPSEVTPAESRPPADEHVDRPSVLYIGAQLREARENLGMTVDDLADRTRIRPFVIDCMESDDFSPCGGDFYARGHLRMLARVLGIASEPLIATYDERFTNDPVSLRAVFDAELSAGTTGMVRGGAAGANWGGLIAAVVLLVVIWGVAKYFAGA
jgi:transcriptional regulator with XRE-family HTH domain